MLAKKFFLFFVYFSFFFLNIEFSAKTPNLFFYNEEGKHNSFFNKNYKKNVTNNHSDRLSQFQLESHSQKNDGLYGNKIGGEKDKLCGNNRLCGNNGLYWHDRIFRKDRIYENNKVEGNDRLRGDNKVEENNRVEGNNRVKGNDRLWGDNKLCEKDKLVKHTFVQYASNNPFPLDSSIGYSLPTLSLYNLNNQFPSGSSISYSLSTLDWFDLRLLVQPIGKTHEFSNKISISQHGLNNQFPSDSSIGYSLPTLNHHGLNNQFPSNLFSWFPSYDKKFKNGKSDRINTSLNFPSHSEEKQKRGKISLSVFKAYKHITNFFKWNDIHVFFFSISNAKLLPYSLPSPSQNRTNNPCLKTLEKDEKPEDILTEIEFVLQCNDNPKPDHCTTGNYDIWLKQANIFICKNQKSIYEKAKSAREKCNEKLEEVNKANKEFSTACTKFSDGTVNCVKALEACSNCPNEEESEDYDCVKIHQKTKCPAKSGEALKTAKEKIEKVGDEKKELEEQIQEKERDIVEKENELNQALSELEEEFSQSSRELERKTEEQKADLEEQLRKNKAKISSAVAKAMSKVQAEIDQALKIAHTFENAITKTHQEYRAERRKIFMACEIQAQARLANYRKRRRAAIRTGSLKISLSSLMKKGRTSFAAKDSRLLKQYNAQCLSKRKPDFQVVDQNYKQKMRVIEQQKEQYQDKITRMKQRVASLNIQASKDQNQLVQEYAASMNKILAAHQKEYRLAMQSYNKAKTGLLVRSKDITLLKKQLMVAKRKLAEKRMELVREAELLSYLENKGVKEDIEDEFANASGAWATIKSDYETAAHACDCKGNNNEKEKCGELARRYDLSVSKDVQRTNTYKGTRPGTGKR